MKVIIHRGTHQIGGVATEIKTEKTRIIIDMGEELGLDSTFVPHPLSITGVTDNNGTCDAILITHYHGDHIGQLLNAHRDIPIYMGEFAKAVLLATLRDDQTDLKSRIAAAKTFCPGVRFNIGDISITPYSIDHSACDSYMFLIEADGKRILHTGDYRLHGFRGKAIPKILERIGVVDTLITEGTTLSRNDNQPVTEYELQQNTRAYLEQYKYVFVLCASTNLERICALSKAVPRGKYFVCDSYQGELLDILQEQWCDYSPLYRDIKKVIYGQNIFSKLQEKGFLMTVRDNRHFREIIRKFDPSQSIILYSMWDGYRTRENSSIQPFLELAGAWESLHTSGHASISDIKTVIDKVNPSMVIPIHTDNPDVLQTICPSEIIVSMDDGKEILV